jgi:ketosteroid isomerase-like protein
MTAKGLTARALFERQIDCLARDDREAQMDLYADNLMYEFPFATDRPRRIEGREEFRKVMSPFWEHGRKRGAKLAGWRADVHDTGDPDFIIAEFSFRIELEGRTFEVPYVQFFRTRAGKIASVREYANPAARAEIEKQLSG